MASTDKSILEHILMYIEQIYEANDLFKADIETIISNSVYRNAVALCVLQIGELSNLLSEDFKTMTISKVPWKEIKGMRNVVAHNYGKIDNQTLWETITNDIPVLKNFCEDQIKLFDTIEAEADEAEECEPT